MYHHWLKEFVGADLTNVRESKSLKEENVRLKRLVVGLSLENQALKESAEGEWEARPANGRRLAISGLL